MAFANSLSGLVAAAKALDVVGNNISNSQTVGFKSSIARFTNVAAASKGGGPVDSASSAGVSADNIFQQLTQGKLEFSNNPLDVAITGLGFFRLYNPETSKVTYTRDGQFRLSFEGSGFPKLVTRSGLSLMGNLPDFTTDPYGTFASAPAPVEITIDPHFPPKATSSVSMNLNLDSRVGVPALPFDPANPLTYNSSTSATVYDAAGASHDLRVFFAKPGAGNLWHVYSTLDYDANAGVPPTSITGPVDLSFDAQGKISTAMPLPAQNHATPGGGIAVGLDLSGVTQFGTSFSVNSISQNGYGEGFIQDESDFSVAADGHVSARYTNGQRRNVAQVVLANFSNPNALLNIGNNQWVANEDPIRGTGAVSLGFPGFSTEKSNSFKGNSDSAEGMGSLQGYAIEQSNVDLAVELVSLIEQQRNYQASAQTFKILDQVLQNLVNMRSQ